MKSIYKASLSLMLLLLVAACGSLERRAAVPQADVTRAEIAGIPNARFWPMGNNDAIVAEALQALQREQALWKQAHGSAPLPPTSFLSISGGGDNGAFGAGLLNGWTALGNRPDFKIVTGVSTGALIAPFAFMGPDYDDELKHVYTSVSQSDIFENRGIMAAITKDGIGDTTPLYKLIASYIDEKFLLLAVAAEYQRGRLLFVGTTNLDYSSP